MNQRQTQHQLKEPLLTSPGGTLVKNRIQGYQTVSSDADMDSSSKGQKKKKSLPQNQVVALFCNLCSIFIIAFFNNFSRGGSTTNLA